MAAAAAARDLVYSVAHVRRHAPDLSPVQREGFDYWLDLYLDRGWSRGDAERAHSGGRCSRRRRRGEPTAWQFPAARHLVYTVLPRPVAYRLLESGEFMVAYRVGTENTSHWYSSAGGWGYYPD